jgi:hypothetical protein
MGFLRPPAGWSDRRVRHDRHYRPWDICVFVRLEPDVPPVEAALRGGFVVHEPRAAWLISPTQEAGSCQSWISCWCSRRWSNSLCGFTTHAGSPRATLTTRSEPSDGPDDLETPIPRPGDTSACRLRVSDSRCRAALTQAQTVPFAVPQRLKNEESPANARLSEVPLRGFEPRFPP